MIGWLKPLFKYLPILFLIVGCESPVTFIYVISANICGEADRGGIARQWREFKTYRKPTAQYNRYSVQSISDIRPAFLAKQNGPYKQYGPISDHFLEEGPGEEVKGLILMEM